MNVKEITDFIPEIGDICLIELPENGKYCLHGLHPGVIYNRVGSNFNVVPITNKKDKLHWCEYPIEKGRCSLNKNSKLKLDQMRPISIEKVKHKIGTADNEIIKAISRYLILEAKNLEKRAA